MATVAAPSRSSAAGDTGVVAGQELRDLWLAGRGLPLMVAFSLLLSVITYLGATNRSLNFLERRETVNLTVQVAVAVGALLAMVVAGDAISGERERGTLESLLLAPVSRRGLAAGKLLAALSLWLAALVVTGPYLWFLARGVGRVHRRDGRRRDRRHARRRDVHGPRHRHQLARPVEPPQPVRGPLPCSPSTHRPSCPPAPSRDGRPSCCSGSTP